MFDIKFSYTKWVRNGGCFVVSEALISLLQRKYDCQVSCQLAKEYLDLIDAPKKEFFTFEESAHSPNLEDSKRFAEVVCSISENK